MTLTISSDNLVSPYGGKLVDLLLQGELRWDWIERAQYLPSVQISARALCDLALLTNGGFSPLRQFMGRADYESVLHRMRLADGTLFPVPITLTLDESVLPRHSDELTLRDAQNHLVAVLQVEEVFRWDPREEASRVLLTNDCRHPLVAEMATWGNRCVAGTLRVLNCPMHPNFSDLCKTPVEVRQQLAGLGRERVVAFQTRNPLHRAHEELTKRAAAEVDGSLLIHPVVGMTKPGDVDHETRVQIYRTVVDKYYDRERTVLALLPLAMRMAGPREALWHAIIRRNYGASHFIVGRDHAGPGKDSHGRPFYAPYDAQALVTRYVRELGVTPVPFREYVYLPEHGAYVEDSQVPASARTVTLSGTEIREEYLATGRRLPDWFTRPETAEILARSYGLAGSQAGAAMGSEAGGRTELPRQWLPPRTPVQAVR